MELKLNENRKERTIGLVFMAIWFAVLIFYLLWDGWVWEWRECGYGGPNQHFDFDFTDMKYEIVNNEVVYYSTNNLFNIIYLCYFTFFMGWTGLVFDNKYLKQGCIATLAFPVIAAMSTLQPLLHHQYVVQIVYNVVHLSGIILGLFLFYHQNVELKKAMPAIMFTWVIYLVSRIIATPWPYWEYRGLAFYSVNQVNDMPFYFYGLEYGAVVLIFVVVNGLFQKLNEKVNKKWFRAVFPFVVFVVLCIVFLAIGFIQIPDITTDTCA